MLKLWKNCDLYAPEHMGKQDILISGSKIWKIAPDLSQWESMEGVEVLDLKGGTVCPGIVDMHIHVTGGGGEQGPASRTPEIRPSELTGSGVTTLLALLGTDGISRSLENLLFKCRALEDFGFTVKMISGNYHFPSPTLTGDVCRDIALVEQVTGVKIALSDHRGSQIGWRELVELGSKVRIGGMISGKKGIVVIHMGDGKQGLRPLFEALENSELPASTFVPTHCSRNPRLNLEAVEFNKIGGNIDYTAEVPEDLEGCAKYIRIALDRGADPGRITVSSDSCGSMPVFDEFGNCVSLTYSTPASLLPELRRLVERENVPMETALRFFTENPAEVIGLGERKGRIRPGFDADLLALSPDFSVRELLMGGVLCVSGGELIRKGNFEG